MKQYFRYQMDFASRWLTASTGCMGLSLFFRMVYYFGITNLADRNFVEILFSALIAAAVSVAYIFLIRLKKLNAPGVYGILGAVMCLCLLLGSILSGSVVRMLLGIVWYLLCGGVILTFAGGYLPGKTPVLAAFGVAIVCRLLFFPAAGLGGWIKELGDLFSLAAFLLLPYGMKAGRMKAAGPDVPEI